jgi:hypothetical protein
MTFEVAENAPERARYEVEQLHELAVNEFGYDANYVLFTAHGDGTISGRIAFNTGRSSNDTDNGRERTTFYRRFKASASGLDPEGEADSGRPAAGLSLPAHRPTVSKYLVRLNLNEYVWVRQR